MVDQPPEPKNTQRAVGDWSQIDAVQLSLGSPTAGSQVEGQREDAPPNSGYKEDRITEQTAKDMQANRDLRGTYAKKAYNLATGCISMWTVLLGTQGVVKALTGAEMWSDQVIIAVTTGVTVSVLAAFLGVIRGLFGNGNNQK